MRKTVAELRKLVSSRLSRALGSDFVVVGSPDHPLVMRSADVLVGGRAGLTAIMIMTSQERRNEKLFSARLALNKMALPSHTNFVFVSIEGERPQTVHTDAFMSEVTIADRKVWDDLILISSHPESARIDKAFGKWQKLAGVRFGDTYRLARVLQRQAGVSKVSPQRSSRRPMRDLLPHNIEAAFFEFAPSLQAIANISMDGADRWYDMNDREPHPTRAPAGAVFAESFPTSPGDPDKAIRAAAFAGWVLTPTGTGKSSEEISELLFRYTRIV